MAVDDLLQNGQRYADENGECVNDILVLAINPFAQDLYRGITFGEYRATCNIPIMPFLPANASVKQESPERLQTGCHLCSKKILPRHHNVLAGRQQHTGGFRYALRSGRLPLQRLTIRKKDILISGILTLSNH